jgi:hypothetical protein
MEGCIRMAPIEWTARALRALFVGAVVSCGATDAALQEADSHGVADDDSKCSIDPSDYDQSCSVDSDCVGIAGGFPVQSGNYCQMLCLCGGGTISRTAIGRYVQDVSETPLGSGAISQGMCSCGGERLPCCSHGHCSVDVLCSADGG